MTQPLEAIIKVGANAHKHVFLTGKKSDNGSKFEIKWPRASAVGYFLPEELYPVGNWHFGADGNIVLQAKQRPTFKNGDPFALIPELHSHPERPILIQLRSGMITQAYPMLCYIVHNEVVYSRLLNDFNFLVCDPYAEAEEIMHIRSMNLVKEQDVVAWQHMPVNL